jgi:hypothetical protein
MQPQVHTPKFNLSRFLSMHIVHANLEFMKELLEALDDFRDDELPQQVFNFRAVLRDQIRSSENALGRNHVKAN